MLTDYRPSNHFSMQGLVFIGLSVLVVGLIFGGIAYAAFQLIWFHFLAPLILGAIAGGILALSISWQRMRNPVLGLIAGFALGIVIYGTMQCANYLKFRSDFQQKISKELDIGNADKQNILIDTLLESKTGSAGFMGYMNLRAQEGITLLKKGQVRIAVANSLAWGYWLIEFLIISCMTAYLAKEQTENPFCETCQQWHKDEKAVGDVAEAHGQEFLTAIRDGNAPQAVSLLGNGNDFPRFEACVQVCQHPEEHPSFFIVRHSTLDNKGKTKTKDVVKGMISATDASALKQGGHRQQEPVLAAS